MTFTPTPPAELGYYMWKSKMNQVDPITDVTLVEIKRDDDGTLVPVEEVEKAFKEGVTGSPDVCGDDYIDVLWNNSRAKRVAE